MTLKPFDGLDVTESAIAITSAGDGLSDALEVEPTAFEIGDRVYVVLDTVCTKVTHEEVKDTNELRRKHTLRTQMGTIVEQKLVHKVLEQQRRAIDEHKGQMTLDDGEGDDE